LECFPVEKLEKVKLGEYLIEFFDFRLLVPVNLQNNHLRRQRASLQNNDLIFGSDFFDFPILYFPNGNPILSLDFRNLRKVQKFPYQEFPRFISLSQNLDQQLFFSNDELHILLKRRI